MRDSMFRSIVAILLVCMLPCTVSASWLSDITGIDVNVPKGSVTFGPPRPDRIPMMLQNLPKDAAIFLLNPLAGNALAYAIREAKESARKVCVPIPATVQRTLTPFFPSDLFQGVCWAIVGNGFTLDSYAIHDAGMAAITLEDVVVFRSNQDGFDPVLWSHELTHVQQYRSLGVEGFAALYSVAWDALEQQAREFDQFVARSLQAANPPQQYWVTSNGWNGRQPIQFQKYASYARQAVTPAQCTTMQYPQRVVNSLTIEDLEIANNCPVSIRITTFYIHGLNGYLREMTCSAPTFVCTIAPGKSERYPEPPNFYKVTAAIVW